MKINLPPERVWLIADTHFFHRNIVTGTSLWPTGGQRDFENELLMTEQVCKNINEKVGKDDILIHLGDWSFGGKDKIKISRDMINCDKIIFCTGNHDINIIKDKSLQSLFYKFYGDIDVSPIVTFHIAGKSYVCSHYNLTVYNQSHHGWRHAFGHSHGSLPDNPNQLSRDVGLDNNNLFPISVVEFEEFMKLKKYKEIDHHKSENKS